MPADAANRLTVFATNIQQRKRIPVFIDGMLCYYMQKTVFFRRRVMLHRERILNPASEYSTIQLYCHAEEI